MELSLELQENTLNIFKKILRPFIPNDLITNELGGVYSNRVLREMGEIIKYYNIYENGADFPVSANDYVPSQIKYKKIKSFINKQARFMFSNPMDIKILNVQSEDKDNDNLVLMQQYINEVLKKNHFKANVLAGAKDCLIGKRIAIICNFSPLYGITISFLSSLEFVYDVDDFGNVTKIIAFSKLDDEDKKENQRLKKKKYWLESDGYCHVSEAIYDGNGKLIESIIEDEITAFNYVPAVVIINDGLLNDMCGNSEITNLFEYEQAYSKISNLDIDSEKAGMNPITWLMDVDKKSSANLSNAPGALWDLATDKTTSDDTNGQVGVLERNLSYSEPLRETLNRLEDTMYEIEDMPKVTTSELKGIVTSGKTFKAIYWGLIVHCDEKMLSWKYEIEHLIKMLIDGALLYPEIAGKYILKMFNDNIDYTIEVNNNYALPEDEQEEMTIDMAQVEAQVMSKKSYIKKWRNLTDDEVDEELKQIALERQILEDSYYPSDNKNNNTNSNDENEENYF